MKQETNKQNNTIKYMFILIISILIGTGTSLIIPYIISENGQHINLHSSNMTDEYHEYRMYESKWDAYFDKNPIATCRLPINDNGNYPENPSASQLRRWISMAETYHSVFTFNGYLDYINR